MEPDLHDYFLLATKLTMPQSYANVIVPRPRLYDKLAVGTRSPLGIIAAPAGSGKTTLLCDWLRQRALPLAWVSLEERDNDSVSFWNYILAALKKYLPAVEKTQENLLRLPLPATNIGEDFFITLINALVTLPEDVWLVLDDYHTIISPAIHAALEFLFEHMPPQLHLVLISRAVPPFPLARLRAGGQLFELQATDLRFTFEEAATFLQQSVGLTLSKDETMTLNNSTEGWITGLQLAALSLQHRQNLTAISKFIQTFSGTNRSILNYLTEEVLAHVPDEVQTFLLFTSILKSFNASLCDAVTERNDSDVILAWLERTNLFLVRLDEQEGWYRYHTLLADMLIYRLRHTISSSHLKLYRRASYWYEQHGMPLEAVETAFQAEQMDRAADLIERCGWSFISPRQTMRIYRWISQLEGKVTVLHRPLFCMLNAICQLQRGNIDKFERLISIAERIWQAQDNAIMRICSLALRVYQEALCGNSEHAIAYGQQAWSLAQSKHLDTDVPLVSLGMAYLQNGNIDKAYVMLTSGYSISKRNKNSMLTTSAELFLGDLFSATGNLPKAAEYYHLCMQDLNGNIPHLCAILHIRQARLCYEWNDLAGANNHVQQSILIAEEHAQDWLKVECYLMQAQLAWQQNALNQALALLQKAEMAAQTPQWLHRPRDYMAVILLRRIHYLLAIDKQDEAVVWLRHYEETGNIEGNQAQRTLIEREAYAQARARILIAQKQSVEAGLAPALKELEQAEQSAHDQGRVQSELSFLLLLAQVYHLLKDTKNVKRILEHILTIAEKGHYIRTLLDEGDMLLSLFTEFYYYSQKRAGEGQEQARFLHATNLNEQRTRLITYAGMLLHHGGHLYTEKTLPLAQRIPTSRGEKTRNISGQPPPVVTLSGREQEVLRLIAEGHSNHEIARTLVVAESTIKTHLNNIYAKLHVNSRLQALTRAHACGLLDLNPASEACMEQ